MAVDRIDLSVVAAGMRRLMGWAALFVLLTLAGAIWALSRAPVGLAELDPIFELSAPVIVLLVALCAGIYVTDVLRYRALADAVGTTVSWRAGFDTSVANFFFSWITPGSTFGVPATIYMLGRRGVPWDATVVIAFAKAFTGVAVVVVASLAFIALGLGPRFDGAVLGVVLFGGSVFAILFGSLIAAAIRPAPAQRVVARVFGWVHRRAGGGHRLEAAKQVTVRSIDRLTQLRTGGALPLLRLAIAHLAYFTVFAAIGVVLLHAFGAEVGLRAFTATIIYIAFTYLAPTPGGAGFAESMALPFFGSLLPDQQAIAFVLCFRGLTLYLQIGFAIPYMLVIGGVGEIARRTERRDA
jgi:uncharacterized protein (TIRG00374 family)